MRRHAFTLCIFSCLLVCSAKGFDPKAPTPAKVVAEEATDGDRKWKLQAHNAEEWVVSGMEWSEGEREGSPLGGWTRSTQHGVMHPRCFA